MQCPCGHLINGRYHMRVDGTKVLVWECPGCGRRREIEQKDGKRVIRG